MLTLIFLIKYALTNQLICFAYTLCFNVSCTTFSSDFNFPFVSDIQYGKTIWIILCILKSFWTCIQSLQSCFCYQSWNVSLVTITMGLIDWLDTRERYKSLYFILPHCVYSAHKSDTVLCDSAISLLDAGLVDSTQ